MPVSDLPQSISADQLPAGVELMTFPVHGDHRGSLIAIEAGIHVPFDIKRVYTLFHTNADMVRGCHAHRDMKQLILNMSGSYRLLIDDGETRVTLAMDKPGVGVYISGYVWRELSDFSADSVINCYVDKFYEDCIYTHSYEEFIASAPAKGSVRDE